MMGEFDFFSKVINSTNALAKKLGLSSLMKINDAVVNGQSVRLVV